MKRPGDAVRSTENVEDAWVVKVQPMTQLAVGFEQFSDGKGPYLHSTHCPSRQCRPHTTYTSSQQSVTHTVRLCPPGASPHPRFLDTLRIINYITVLILLECIAAVGSYCCDAAFCYRWSVWSVCVSVSRVHDRCGNNEPIEMMVGGLTQVGPWNHVLNGLNFPPREWAILGLCWPIEKHC